MLPISYHTLETFSFIFDVDKKNPREIRIKDMYVFRFDIKIS